MPNEYDEILGPASETAPAPAPAPADTDPYADIIAQQAGARAAALKASMSVGAAMKPEEHAKAMALADQTGIPSQVVARNLPQVQRQATAGAVDYAAMQRKHPELAEWLSNPDHAGIAHPDVDALQTLSGAVQAMAHPEWDINHVLPPGFTFARDGSIEERIKQPGGGVLANTYPDLHAVSLELAARGNADLADDLARQANVQALQDKTGILANVVAGAASSISATQSLLGTSTPDNRLIAQRIAQASSDISPGFFGDVQRFTGSMLADVPLLMAGGPLAHGAGALMQTSRVGSMLARLGLEGSERVKAGVEVAAAMQPFAIRQAAQTTDEQGAAQGAMDWLINTAVPGAFGKVGIGKVLTEGMGAANAADGWAGVAKRLLLDAGAQGGVGASTYAATALERLATGGQGAPESSAQFFQELAKNGALGALAGTAFNLGPAVGDKFLRDATAGHAALSFEEKAAQAVESLKAAKVNELAPGRVQELMDKILGDGAPKTVYLQGKDFQDHALALGEDPANKAEAMGLGKEYREAQALGHDMAIPTSTFLQEAAKAEDPKALLVAVRQTPNAKTAEEARTFVEKAPEQLDAQTKAALAKLEEHNASPEGQREAAEIHEEIKRQLIEAGTGEGVAERQAEVTAATFRTIAQRQTMGGNPTTAMELLKQFPLTIQRELPAVLRSREHQASMDAMLDAIRKHGVAQPVFAKREGAADDRHADIISEIDRQGGIAKKAADQEGGEYDSMPTLRGAHAKIMRGDLKPDQMAALLHEQGFGDGTPDTMWKLVEDAIATRKSAQDRDPQPLTPGEESLAAIKRQLDAIGVDLSKMTNAQAREAIAKHTESTSYQQADEEQRPVDTSHLSQPARSWLSALKPEEVRALESSIAHFAQHPDPAGDLANLQMVHDFLGQPRRYNQPAYHGTPHKFDKFTTDHMSSGEGHQAFGWGLYFAGNKKVAEWYREALTGNREFPIETLRAYFKPGRVIEGYGGGTDKVVGFHEKNGNWSVDVVNYDQHHRAEVDDIQRRIAEAKADAEARPHSETSRSILRHWERELQRISRNHSTRPKMAEVRAVLKDEAPDSIPGRLYHVQIPEDHEYLDFDKRVSEQSETVKAALEKLGVTDQNATGASAYNEIASNLGRDVAVDPNAGGWGSTGGKDATKAREPNPEAASKALLALGVKGNKFADAGSRTMKADKSHNYVIFDGADAAIRTYEQPDSDDSKGSITFGKEGPAIIRLFQGADESTFMHEMGHFWLEVMGHLAGRDGATEQVREDYAAILKWMGVDKREDIQVEHHEMWARGFERYLMEGRAPSSALRRAFQAFKTWLTMIYRSVGALKSELSPEVRAVMDRLVATDDEIVAAQDRVGGAPNFANREESGFDEKTWAEYQRAVDDSREQAETKLRVEALSAEHAAYSEKWNRQRDEYRERFAAVVNDEPVYKAIAALQRGTEPDGTTLPDELRGLKLDRADLVARYGEEHLKDLPGHRIKGEDRPNAGQKVYAAEGGISLDDAASMFGFPHANALWEAMVNAPDRRSKIDDMANAAMREQYPDPLLNGTLPEKAEEAIQTADALAKRLDLEVKALGLRIGQKASAFEVVREFARQRVGETPVRDLNPNRYKVAQAKAARDAFKAATGGKYDEAFIAKQREMFNYAMHKETLARQEAAEKQVAYIRSLQKDSAQQRIGKAGGWEWTVTYENGTSKTFTNEDAARKEAGNNAGAVFNRTSSYLDQINKIMERFDFSPIGRKSLAARLSLRDWIATIENQIGPDGTPEPTGFVSAIPESLRDETFSKSYKELTANELQDVHDSLENIAFLAGVRNKFLKNARMMEVGLAVQTAAKQIAENSFRKQKKEISNGLLHKVTDAFARTLASEAAVSRVINEMDGFKDNGFMWNLWQRPLNEARSHELDMEEKSIAAMTGLRQRWGAIKAFDVRSMWRRESIPGIPQQLHKWDRLMTFLNWGNAGNRDRLMKSYGWTKEQVRTIIDTLSKKDMEYAQGVLDHINSYKSEVKAKMERVQGVASEMVEGLPIETKHGTFKGGYFPIKYKSGARRTSAIEEDAGTLTMRGKAMAAYTNRGHEKERTGMPDGAQIDLDPGVIDRHLRQVIHDLSHHETLIDLNRLLGNKDFRGAISDHWGDGFTRQFQSQLEGVAGGNQTDPTGMSALVRHVRLGGLFSTRAFRLGAALRQLPGITFSIPTVGAKHWLSALKTMSNPAAMAKAVHWAEENSAELRNRGKTADRNLSDAMQGINLKGPVRRLINKAGYYFWTQAFRALDTHTYLAAYEKGITEGMTHEDAKAVADQAVVDTQGSGEQKDIPAIMRHGELMQVFTSSMSWFLSQWNQTARAWNLARARKGAGASAYGPLAGVVGAQAFKLGLTMFVYYGIGTALYSAWSGFLDRNTDDWKDPNKLAKKLSGELAYNVAGNFVGVREMAPTLESGQHFQGPQSMRAWGWFADSLLATGDLKKGLTDHDERALFKAAGALFHLPAGMILDGLDAVHDAQEQGPSGLLDAALGKPPKAR